MVSPCLDMGVGGDSEAGVQQRDRRHEQGREGPGHDRLRATPHAIPGRPSSRYVTHTRVMPMKERSDYVHVLLLFVFFVSLVCRYGHADDAPEE